MLLTLPTIGERWDGTTGELNLYTTSTNKKKKKKKEKKRKKKRGTAYKQFKLNINKEY